MQTRLAAVAALIMILTASGCAGTDPATVNTSQRDELVYRTGSNIPVRGKTPMTPEEKEKQAEEARRTFQQMQTTGAGNPRVN